TDPSHTTTLSLHDALPIFQARDGTIRRIAFPDRQPASGPDHWSVRLPPFITVVTYRSQMRTKCRRLLQDAAEATPAQRTLGNSRSEEHTSELQSLRHLVCR